MSILGAFEDEDRIDAIRRRYPNFNKSIPIPEDAKFWREQDIELFFNSGGETKPQQLAKADVATCPFLSSIRLAMAENNISESTADYRSFCKYMKGSRGAWRLPCSSCKELRAVNEQDGTGSAAGPYIVEKQRDWKARDWNLKQLAQLCGAEMWKCYTQLPPCEDDLDGVDSFSISTSISEYAEYTRLMHRSDRKCLDDNIIAYPRVSLEAYSFSSGMQEAFDKSWQELGPTFVEDLTAAWLERTSGQTNWDWREKLRSFYRLDIQATGSIVRLHCESAGAHTWLNQIEGRRVFFLFPPTDEEKLYSMPMKAKGGTDVRVSPVDIFYPSAKRHPKFNEATCQVATLYLGQTLVIPSGWWWYSVAIEPSVTLSHNFWNADNRKDFSSSLWRFFDMTKATEDTRQSLAAELDEVQRIVMEDADEDD